LSFIVQVLRHREPHPTARVVEAVHSDDRRGHMDTGRGAGHAVGHVLVPGHRGDTQHERDHRVLLPVSKSAGRGVRTGHGHVQAARVLRGAAVRDRVLLPADGPPPDGVHAQHARGAAARRPVGSDPGPEEGGQDGAVVRRHIHDQLPSVPRVHGVVPLQFELPRRVRRLLARVPHRRLLPELHQLVREPRGAVLHQRRVPQTLQPVPVLLLPVRPVRPGHRRVHHPGHQPDARQQHVVQATQLGRHQPRHHSRPRHLTGGLRQQARHQRQTPGRLQRRLTTITR